MAQTTLARNCSNTNSPALKCSRLKALSKPHGLCGLECLFYFAVRRTGALEKFWNKTAYAAAALEAARSRLRSRRLLKNS
jgi:hypothetical protein